LSVTGVVAALEFEARSLGDPGDGSIISISGIGADNAARSARALVAAGAGALLSWGVAGALDPALACGTAVLPGEVLRAHGEPGGAALQRFAQPLLGVAQIALRQGRIAILDSQRHRPQQIGDREEIRAGDTVHAHAGEVHWHGAAPGTFLTHLAVQEGETEWAERAGRGFSGTTTAGHDGLRRALPGVRS